MSSGPPVAAVSYTLTAPGCGIARAGGRSAPRAPGVWGTLGRRLGLLALGPDGSGTGVGRAGVYGKVREQRPCGTGRSCERNRAAAAFLSGSAAGRSITTVASGRSSRPRRTGFGKDARAPRGGPRSRRDWATGRLKPGSNHGTAGMARRGRGASASRPPCPPRSIPRFRRRRGSSRAARGGRPACASAAIGSERECGRRGNATAGQTSGRGAW
jgi:hypothetical protein